MKTIEAKIKQVLNSNGIKCSSVFWMPDPDETRILLSFNSKENNRLTTTRIDRVLNSTGMGDFKVPKEFQRLSSAFLHLEIALGAKTEKTITPEAM
ncbi:MAG: hypothetical protein JW779_01035 [Candidatus Thorarchaeota archaeon]|nr:hypothetical protein [Candidatus Thorarchaeota archaeon]